MFDPKTWHDGKLGATPITAAELNRIEQGIAAADTTADGAVTAATNLLKPIAANPDQIAVGAITRSTTGAATAFSVVWPDGATGTFTGTESSVIPGAIDSYTVTHVLGGNTTTYTQPALTRDATGAVTNRPAIVVS